MPVLGQFSGHILLNQLLTLKFILDLRLNISMMSFASETFHYSLLFLLLFTITSQTLAKPSQNVANSTSVPKETQHCNNVYFYEAPNKEIAKLLRKITNQLTQVQNDVNILKGNKTSSKGKALTGVIFFSCISRKLINRLQIYSSSCFYLASVIKITDRFGYYDTNINKKLKLPVYQNVQYRQNLYPFFLRKHKEL